VEREQRGHRGEGRAEQDRAAVAAARPDDRQCDRGSGGCEGAEADARKMDPPADVHLLMRHEAEEGPGHQDPRGRARQCRYGGVSGEARHPQIIGSRRRLL
jgi:hypothetical protein